ncbi:hypothetical protein RV08_GL000540 [Enterococcus mundtii]|uniref:Uncharacterized protein n=1 Tax=Enterococcus mundtii TaxID=53346 RepID=A0ABQ0VDT7_ENTMU|nr:hypothetical protein RV08_GL000540 [Enterococcus mundtii]GEL80640.1 hypothetical protein EMU01_17840 [Enterococcus mundtii]GEN18678.1 hypothetical protein LAC02_19590 [Ligilactobacillus acidipiscis]
MKKKEKEENIRPFKKNSNKCRNGMASSMLTWMMKGKAPAIDIKRNHLTGIKE